MKATPIYIFSGERSLPVANLQATALLESGFRRVAIVCPRGVAPSEELSLGTVGEDRNIPEIIYDEDVRDFSAIVGLLDGLPEKRGWYKQQFLKLLVVKNASEDVVILDGDTIFKPSVVREMINGALFVNNENVYRYRSFNTLLELRTTDFERSFVANGMFVPRAVGGLLSIELCRRVINEKRGRPDLDFSEYQFVGALRRAMGKYSKIKTLRLFRRADLLAISPDQYLTKLCHSQYDALAFEYGHQRSTIRALAAKLLFAVGYSW
ncbi:MAG: hypothetical protein FJ184_05090 [Gammaproteobacteria bacterium]|nr:hypothetical protein [Gammaproteobacteria bacterium]